jgi:hypothetical protein
MVVMGATVIVFVWLGIGLMNSQQDNEALVSFCFATVWYLILCATYYGKRDK